MSAPSPDRFPTAADIERSRELARAFVATWPERYATVRDTMPLGFVPGCYYAGPQEWGGYNPPTKFHYPPAGVQHPYHADGIGEGAAILAFTHQMGNPDDLRDRPVWQCGPNYLHQQLGGYRCSRYGLTFDEAIAYAIRIGDYLRAHYLIPTVDPETRAPLLTWAEWREVANVVIDIDPAPSPITQLSMFEAPAPPQETSALGKARAALQEAMTGNDYPGDAMVRITVARYDLYDLIDHANRLRMEAGVPPFLGEEVRAA